MSTEMKKYFPLAPVAFAVAFYSDSDIVAVSLLSFLILVSWCWR